MSIRRFAFAASVVLAMTLTSGHVIAGGAEERFPSNPTEPCARAAAQQYPLDRALLESVILSVERPSAAMFHSIPSNAGLLKAYREELCTRDEYEGRMPNAIDALKKARDTLARRKHET